MGDRVYFAIVDSRASCKGAWLAGLLPGREIVKIGHSVSSERAEKFGRVLATEPGGRARERELHERFSALRVAPATGPHPRPDGHSEVFKFEGALREYVALLCPLGEPCDYCGEPYELHGGWRSGLGHNFRRAKHPRIDALIGWDSLRVIEEVAGVRSDNFLRQLRDTLAA